MGTLLRFVILTVAFALALSGTAEALRFRPAKKSPGTSKTKAKSGRGDQRVQGTTTGSRSGPSGIVRRGRKAGASKTGRKPTAARVTARQHLARGVSKMRQAVTLDRFTRAQIGLMKFSSTVSLGAAIATGGRPSIIVVAGVMTAMSYALHPTMRLAEKLGERLGQRMIARSERGGAPPSAPAAPMR